MEPIISHSAYPYQQSDLQISSDFQIKIWRMESELLVVVAVKSGTGSIQPREYN
jgi:hypothetical protein